MTGSIARPVAGTTAGETASRVPRAFSAPEAGEAQPIEPLTEAAADAALAAPPPKSMGWLGRLAWSMAGLLVSLALGLAADQLIRDLFAAAPWLGWLGLGGLGLFVLAIVMLLVREAMALRRLKNLDRLRQRAAAVLLSDKPAEGRAILRELEAVFAHRADLARPRQRLSEVSEMFDGSAMLRAAERVLMAPIDARARALTAASARRVALVTTVSPRALVDIAFVIYESLRLGAEIARLYGARPGLAGTIRLFGAILSHLAVTGGLVLTDGVMEQLVGQGLAAKLSGRLGEGIVNGLMTVRVGIAAMRVVRPLPFDTERQPRVKDFIPDLANVLEAERGK